MIHAILVFQFTITSTETGEMEPEFKPIHLVFKDAGLKQENISDLMSKSDLFSIYYHHTTNVHEITGEYSNFYNGRLKNSPYQINSYYKQLENGSQYLIISLFSLGDELSVFERLIKSMAKKLDYIIESLEKAVNLKQFSLIENIEKSLDNELNYTIFQLERLSHLDKIQIAALILNSKERLKILNTLRERPIAKEELREILERIVENPNINILLEPFLELNLIRRDWIKGERDKRTGMIKNQGEFLFLIKDIALVRVPNINLLEYLKESNNELLSIYQKRVDNFFNKYDPILESMDELKKLTTMLLNPDLYDTFILLRSKFYPLEKIPQISSKFTDFKMAIKELKELNIITEIVDKSNKHWIFLLTDLKPLIFFPEYLLPKISKLYKSKHKQITYEIGRKALELLELAYPEKIEF